MKIKTSELIGAPLDWAVAKCEGKFDAPAVRITDLGSIYWINGGPYAPSTTGSEAIDIIERERIEIRPGERTEGWFGSIHDVFMFMPGPSPLIAAMRCYVVSKMGDEVDIPEELLK